MSFARGSGCWPSIPDLRDFRYQALVGSSVTSEASRSEPFALSPVEDQGRDEACVGYAISDALECRYLAHYGKTARLSPHFLWWLGRSAVLATEKNWGCHPRDVLSAASLYGACHAAEMPRKDGEFTQAPPVRAWKTAERHRISSYHKVNTLKERRDALRRGFPVVTCLTLYKKWWTVARDMGVYPDPAGDKMTGAHAVLNVLYDDEIRLPLEDAPGGYLMKNSHGTAFGLPHPDFGGARGYFWVPARHMANPALSFENWVIEAVPL